MNRIFIFIGDRKYKSVVIRRICEYLRGIISHIHSWKIFSLIVSFLHESRDDLLIRSDKNISLYDRLIPCPVICFNTKNIMSDFLQCFTAEVYTFFIIECVRDIRWIIFCLGTTDSSRGYRSSVVSYKSYFCFPVLNS